MERCSDLDMSGLLEAPGPRARSEARERSMASCSTTLRLDESSRAKRVDTTHRYCAATSAATCACNCSGVYWASGLPLM